MVYELSLYFNKALTNIEIYHGNTNQKKAGVAIFISKWTPKQSKLLGIKRHII